jgi:hypothetical protein
MIAFEPLDLTEDHLTGGIEDGARAGSAQPRAFLSGEHGRICGGSAGVLLGEEEPAAGQLGESRQQPGELVLEDLEVCVLGGADEVAVDGLYEDEFGRRIELDGDRRLLIDQRQVRAGLGEVVGLPVDGVVPAQDPQIDAVDVGVGPRCPRVLAYLDPGLTSRPLTGGTGVSEDGDGVGVAVVGLDRGDEAVS